GGGVRRASRPARLRRVLPARAAAGGGGASAARGYPRPSGALRPRRAAQAAVASPWDNQCMVVQQRETVAAPDVADAAAEADAFVAALAQVAPRLGDVAANLERHLEIITQAAGAGANIVVFPELSLTGYFLKDLVPDVALPIDSDETSRLAAAARASVADNAGGLRSEDQRRR